MTVTTRLMFDLSHNNQLASLSFAQDAPLFAKAKAAGWMMMFHKLTQGASFVDPMALGRIKYASSAGLHIGVYHYMTGDDPIASQVAYFTMAAAQAISIISPLRMMLALDFEPGFATIDTTDMADQFVTALRHALGIWPVLYTGRWDIAAPEVKNTNLPACKMWLGEFGTNPVCPPGWTNWQFHQYSDGIRGPDPVNIPGIGFVDQSEFAGSPAELNALFGQSSITSLTFTSP